jgi:hypothetical protein
MPVSWVIGKHESKTTSLGEYIYLFRLSRGGFGEGVMLCLFGLRGAVHSIVSCIGWAWIGVWIVVGMVL